LCLLEASPHLLSLLRLHDTGSFSPPPLDSPSQSSHEIEIPQQLLRGTHRRGMLFFQLPLRPQEKLRVLHDPAPHVPGPLAPGPDEIADLAAGEAVLRDRLCERLAVLALATRQRHQVLDRRLRRDHTAADVFLDRSGQDLHQRQPLGHPAHAPVKPLRQILQAQGKIPQLQEQPGLLDRRLCLHRPQRPHEDQGLRLAHVPHRRRDGVLPQASQETHTLAPVDHLVAAGILAKGHHHDRHLLSLLGERGEKPPLPLRAPHVQVLVPHLELVKFQIHPKSAAATTAPSTAAMPRISLRPRPRPDRRVTPCPKKRRLPSESEGLGKRGLRVTGGVFCPTLFQLASLPTKQGLKIPT